MDMAEIATGRERFASLDKHENHRFIDNESEDVVIESKEEMSEQPKIQSEDIEKETLIAEEHENEHHDIDPDIEVKGYNTLNEISELYNVPSSVIIKELKIPESTLGSSKLGHLRKQYGFTMSDVELVIHNYKNK